MADKRKLKLAIQWLIWSVGLLVGLCTLALAGGSADFRSGEWLPLIGTLVLALCFAAGSICALWSRRCASAIFFASMPIVAFCFGYPGAGYLEWRSDGGWFVSPLPDTALGLTAVFYLPVAAALFGRRSRKRALISIGAALLIAIPVFVTSHWTRALLPRLAGWSVPFALFAGIWFLAEKHKWPALRKSRPNTGRERAKAVALIVIATFVADLVLTFVLTALTSGYSGGECNKLPLITHPLSADHTVFTARIVYAGLSLGNYLDIHTARRSRFNDVPPPDVPADVGTWAVAVVEHEYWGLPSWMPRVLLVTNAIFWKGKTYLIDGQRGFGR